MILIGFLLRKNKNIQHYSYNSVSAKEIPGIILRPVQEKDIDLIFQLSNDPLVRNNSFNTEVITYETHTEWFRKTLMNKSIFFLAVEVDGLFAGQVRYATNNDYAEISISITSQFRGRCLGSTIVRMADKMLKKQYPFLMYVTARTKPDNIASGRIFISAGYLPVPGTLYPEYRLSFKKKNQSRQAQMS